MTAPAAVLLDIEGTTTPISFVYQVLFPYARQHFEDFLKQHWEIPEVQSEAIALGASCVESAVQLAVQAMDEDRKLGPLKALQGRIWEDGYRRGRLRGQLFPEVAEALKAWREAGISVNIYSSGSVLAQKLLFGFSEAGDLQPWIDGYFDTAVGAKSDPQSYTRIATSLKMNPSDGVFATDIVGEAEAARQAGWRAVILRRPGNHPQPEHDFPEWAQFPSPFRL